MSDPTTASTALQPTPDLEEMARVLKDAQRTVEWVLIAPDGRTWITDKPEKLFQVLAPHHPLLKGFA